MGGHAGKPHQERHQENEQERPKGRDEGRGGRHFAQSLQGESHYSVKITS